MSNRVSNARILLNYKTVQRPAKPCTPVRFRPPPPRINDLTVSRGCWRDNVFVERLWRSIKYEEIYLQAYETVAAAKQGLARYLDFYNTRRPHTALGKQTPDTAYFDQIHFQAA